MGKHGPSESVEFGGVKYRRYPQSERRDLRVYFTSQRGRRLHRAIWESVNGSIPDEFHVHHIDENPINNAIENLALIEGREHLRQHMDSPERKAKSRESVKLAIAAAPAWHRSDAGRQWHVEHGRSVMEQRPMVEHRCVVCGRSYESKATSSHVCGAACFAKQRRNSGVDDVDVVCPECGTTFRRNRYAKPGCCSRSCSSRRTNRARGSRLQPRS